MLTNRTDLAPLIAALSNPGELVRCLRLQAGLTQRELAGFAGVYREAVYRLETGRCATNLAVLLAILKALELELSMPGREALRRERMTPDQAAEMLSITPGMVRRLCRQGLLEARKEKGRWIIRTASVKAWKRMI